MSKPQDQDAPEAAAPEAAAPAKKKFAIPKVAIIAAVILVQIVGSYFLQKMLLFDGGPLAAHADAAEAKAEPKEEEESEKAEESEVWMLDELVINPAETGGRRYLSVTMGLQMPAGEESKAVVEKNAAVIRDTLITLLSAKHLDELADPGRRDSLKLEIKEAVNKRLHGAPVKSVVFSGYVLQ